MTPLAQTLPQFLSEPHQPPSHILKPWIQEGAITMLYGPRGGGKTGFTLALALAVSAGQRLTGEMHAPKGRRVLYVDGEMHPSEMHTRLQKFINGGLGWDTTNLALLTTNFALLSHTFLDTGFPDIGSDAGQRLIEREVAAHHADLLILDNLSALLRSGEENSNDSWNAMGAWLLTFRRQNVATLLIHHAGKRDMEGQIRQRGASRREDNLDAVLQVDEAAKPRGGRVPLKLTYEKCRSFTPEEREVQCSLMYDDEASRAWIEDGNYQRRENQEPPKWFTWAQTLREQGQSYGAIGLALGVPKPTVFRWLTGERRTIGTMDRSFVSPP